MAGQYGNSLHQSARRESASSWEGSAGRGPSGEEPMQPVEAAMEFFREYSRERPEVVAMWAFGIGFVLAWKLKPW